MCPICPPWCGCHGDGRCLATAHALNIMQSWASGGRTREPILMKFGTQQQVRTTMTVMRSNINIFKIQNGGWPPCWKIFEMPYLAYQWTDWDATWVVTSHHAPTCPPWCGSHGNGRCLATAHCTFSSYGRLEAEQVNQFWWNLVYNSKLGPQWQSRDQILKFSKFKMADSRHVQKY